jgi:hypothetical protein
MDTSIRQQTQTLLDQLPPEALEELAQFIEFLVFKYHLDRAPIASPSTPTAASLSVPADSLTAHFQGFIQSPLTVAELSTAYELDLMGDEE